VLQIEIDLFSGRPNPVWILTDLGVVRDFLGIIAEAKGVTANPGTGFTGLGFREVRVRVLADDELQQSRLPNQFALASTAVECESNFGIRVTRAQVHPVVPAGIQIPETLNIAPLHIEVILKPLKDSLTRSSSCVLDSTIRSSDRSARSIISRPFNS
jgi:hypothetical protein